MTFRKASFEMSISEYTAEFTMFENSSKMSRLAFSTNFCPIKTDLSSNTIWPFLAFLTQM